MKHLCPFWDVFTFVYTVNIASDTTFWKLVPLVWVHLHSTLKSSTYHKCSYLTKSSLYRALRSLIHIIIPFFFCYLSQFPNLYTVPVNYYSLLLMNSYGTTDGDITAHIPYRLKCIVASTKKNQDKFINALSSNWDKNAAGTLLLWMNRTNMYIVQTEVYVYVLSFSGKIP